MAITLPVTVNPFLFVTGRLEQALVRFCWLAPILIASASAAGVATGHLGLRHLAPVVLLGALFSVTFAVAVATLVGLLAKLIGPCLMGIPALSKRVVTADNFGVHRNGAAIIRRDEVVFAFKPGKRDVVFIYDGPCGISTVLRTDSEGEADEVLQAVELSPGELSMNTRLVMTTPRKWIDLAAWGLAFLALLSVPYDWYVEHQFPAWCAVLLSAGQPALVLIAGAFVKRKSTQIVFGFDGLCAPGILASRFIPYADIVSAKFDNASLVLGLETDREPIRVTLERLPDNPAATNGVILNMIERRRSAAKQNAIAARPIAASLRAGQTGATSYRVATPPPERWLDVVADGASDVQIRVQAADAVLAMNDESLRDELRSIAEGSACAQLLRYRRRG